MPIPPLDDIIETIRAAASEENISEWTVDGMLEIAIECEVTKRKLTEWIGRKILEQENQKNDR